MINFCAISRKLHRVLVLMIVFLTAVMALTGIIMKYPNLAGSFDLGAIRHLHNQVSLLFTIVLVAMAGTGLYMYIYIWYEKRKARNNNTNP